MSHERPQMFSHVGGDTAVCGVQVTLVVLKQREQVITVVVGKVRGSQVGQQLIRVGQIWKQLWKHDSSEHTEHTDTHTVYSPHPVTLQVTDWFQLTSRVGSETSADPARPKEPSP